MDFISDPNYSRVLHAGNASSDSWQSVLLIDHPEWETMKLRLWQLTSFRISNVIEVIYGGRRDRLHRSLSKMMRNTANSSLVILKSGLSAWITISSYQKVDGKKQKTKQNLYGVDVSATHLVNSLRSDPGPRGLRASAFLIGMQDDWIHVLLFYTNTHTHTLTLKKTTFSKHGTWQRIHFFAYRCCHTPSLLLVVCHIFSITVQKGHCQALMLQKSLLSIN